MKSNFKNILFLAITSFVTALIQSQDYHWQFNDNQVIYTAGYATTLKNTNPTMFIPGKIDRAISFHKVTQFPYSEEVSLGKTGSYSISFWVYISSSPISGEEYFIAAKRKENDQFQIFINDFNELEFYLFDQNSYNFTNVVSNQQIPCNKWSHITITVSNKVGNRHITMYLDGVQINKEPFYFTPNTVSSTIVFGNKILEKKKEDDEEDEKWCLKGAIDDFRINGGRVILYDEIQTLANKNPEANHRWKFDEYQTKPENDEYRTIIKDFRGYKDGRMNRILATVPGKIGYSALKLEENALNYISINNVETSNTKSYSLSFWIKPNQKLPSSSYTILKKRETKNQYQVTLLPNGQIRFHLWGHSYQSVSSTTITVNKWTNVIITVDNATKTIKIFKNGILDAENNFDFEPWYGVDQLIIGDEQHNATSEILLDDVRIYNNKTLSQDVISKINNYKELPTSVTTPIKYERYSQTEYKLFDYDPNFIPGPVSFDSKNVPYIRKEGYVQTIENGQWMRLDFTKSIKKYFPEWNGKFDHNESIDTRIIFDDSDWAYTYVKIDDASIKNNIVLYSLDKCRTWKVLQLDKNDEKWQLGLWESKQAHNELQYPPILLTSKSSRDTVVKDIGINIFEKDGNVLKYKDYGVIKSAHIGVTHSAVPSQVVTKKDTTYLIYSKRYETGQTQDGNATYVHKIDRTQKLPSIINKNDSEFVGYAGENNKVINPKTDGADGHNYGSLVIDSKGVLHAVLSGHHDKALKYTRSKKAYAIDNQWEKIKPFGSESNKDGHTYNSLICGKNDRLYCITRWSGINFEFRIALMTKDDDRSDWSRITSLVRPHETNYHKWYQTISMDRNNNLYMNYQLSHQKFTEKGGYDSYMKNWPEDTINLVKDTNNIEQIIAYKKDYQYTKVRPKYPSMLRLAHNKSNWSLVTTQDFINTTLSLSKNNKDKSSTVLKKEDSFVIAPNPSDQYTNLQLHQVPSKGSKLIIYDISGRSIKTMPIIDKDITVDISDVEKGIYLFEVTGNNKGIKKVLIE